MPETTTPAAAAQPKPRTVLNTAPEGWSVATGTLRLASMFKEGKPAGTRPDRAEISVRMADGSYLNIESHGMFPDPCPPHVVSMAYDPNTIRHGATNAKGLTNRYATGVLLAVEQRAADYRAVLR